MAVDGEDGLDDVDQPAHPSASSTSGWRSPCPTLILTRLRIRGPTDSLEGKGGPDGNTQCSRNPDATIYQSRGRKTGRSRAHIRYVRWHPVLLNADTSQDLCPNWQR